MNFGAKDHLVTFDLYEIFNATSILSHAFSGPSPFRSHPSPRFVGLGNASSRNTTEHILASPRECESIRVYKAYLWRSIDAIEFPAPFLLSSSSSFICRHFYFASTSGRVSRVNYDFHPPLDSTSRGVQLSVVLSRKFEASDFCNGHERL